MKRRLLCICFFHFFIIYFSILFLVNTTHGNIPTPNTSNVVPENVSANSASEEKKPPSDNANTVNSDSDIELNTVVHSSFEDIGNHVNVETFSSQDHVYTEAASQNSGLSNGVGDAGPAVVFTVVDAATAELQQKADVPSAATSQNETPSLSTVNSTEKETDQVTIVKEPDNGNTNTYESIALNGSEQVVNIPQTDKLDLELPNTEPKTNATESVANIPIASERSEDIPSFSEWTQKQLEEAEKKKELVNNSAQNQNWNGKQNSSLKVRSKNYASPDCGAKIIAANPETTNAGAVLSASKDEYNLNVCTNRIWFIVELCEAIQAKKIDIANFELFSSSPKDFTVSVSDRFPSREWSNVGQFVAKDEKDVQSFELSPHLFGKYVKVEVHSHYGSEHFCPISLFRVYGTSEFEVLEKEDLVHLNIEDDDDDETLDSEKGISSKNLFSSATDAVISIVKKAAEVLVTKGNTSSPITVVDRPNKTIPTPLISTCSTVSHYVVCDNCSDILFGYVYELLSCNSKALDALVSVPFIKKALYDSEICEAFGLDFQSKSAGSKSNVNSAYIKAVFAVHYLAALCNTVAVIEDKVVLNVSNKFLNATEGLNLSDIENVGKIETLEPHIKTDFVNDDSKSEEIFPTEELSLDGTDKATLLPGGVTEISYTSQIKPTKTLSPDEDLDDTKSIPTSDKLDEYKIVQATDSLTIASKTIETNGGNEKQILEQEYIEGHELSSESISEFETTTESSETLEEHLEHIISDLNGEATTGETTSNDSSASDVAAGDSTAGTSSPSISRTPTPPGPKESVFLRLSNRIKALERNMSLSSQYLEELSRRYKKQVEEMQRLLDKTLSTWTEENRKHEERSQRLEEQIMALTSIVETLVTEKNNWIHTTYWLFLFVVALVGVLTFCRRSPESKQYTDDSSKDMEVQRRKSIDIVRHKTPLKKKRRPSEEALKITGTYQHLMVDDSGAVRKGKEKKRRKKKPSLPRSNSITTLTEEAADFTDQHRSSSSELNARYSPKKISSKLWTRQASAPAQISPTWSEASAVRNFVEDIPFVLEESENSPLEPIPVKPEASNGVKSQEHNGNAFLSNIRHLTSSSFMRTARDTRLNRHPSVSSAPLPVNNGKSKQESGGSSSPEGSIQRASGNLSLNSSLEEKVGVTPKKEKKGGIKRILRKVF